MNEEKIVQNMINFIEEKERDLQAEKLIVNNQMKTDIVKAILNKLENELTEEGTNEDKKD